MKTSISRSMFIVFSILALLVIAPDVFPEEGQDDAPPAAASDQEVSPMTKGDTLPEVTMKNLEGEEVALKDTLGENMTVLVFYRGGWCPYCNVHLADLARIEPLLAKQNVKIIGISPDSPEALMKTRNEKAVSYELLSDSDTELIRQMRLAFVSKYDDKENPGEKKVLPVPAVYIVDGNGKIVYSYWNSDYSKRLSGDELLEELKSTNQSNLQENKED